MENASKALIMAAGVLIGISILAVFVYLFRAGGRVGESYEQKQSQEQLQLFNSRFENFDRNNNTIIDMISVTNLAIATNTEYDAEIVTIDIELSSGKTLNVRGVDELERNYIFDGKTGTAKIYVYDLLDKNLDDLNILTGSTDTLSMVNNEMKYKYFFESKNIQYDEMTGRVNYMKFVRTDNPDF